MENEKGIVLLAAKNPYYGRMAYNLAVTIKANAKDIPVAVIHSGRGLSHLNEKQLKMFDHLIYLQGDELTLGLKLQVFEFSPFQKTLYIDADNLWIPNKNPHDLFAQLDGVQFTAITEGYFDLDELKHDIRQDYFLWADPHKMVDAYDLRKGKIYQWRSEVMYFEKCEPIREMFNTATEIYSNPKVEVIQFASVIPDEFSINIAANIHGINPHVYKWQPSYWDKIHGGRFLPLPHIMNQFWIMSTGGNVASPSMKKTYNQIVGAACYKLKVQNMFLLEQKRTVLTERQKM